MRIESTINIRNKNRGGEGGMEGGRAFRLKLIRYKNLSGHVPPNIPSMFYLYIFAWMPYFINNDIIVDKLIDMKDEIKAKRHKISS